MVLLFACALILLNMPSFFPPYPRLVIVFCDNDNNGCVEEITQQRAAGGLTGINAILGSVAFSFVCSSFMHAATFLLLALGYLV
jgi:hypothetical protein